MGTRVKVYLRSVSCKDTEDITGADDFYCVGGGAVVPARRGKAVESTARLSEPLKINDGQTKYFPKNPKDQTIVFEGDVDEGDFVECQLSFYDEDFSAPKDWDAKYDALLSAIGSAIGSAVGALVAPVAGTIAGAIAGAAFPAAVKVWDRLDKDDLLGTVEKRFKVAELKTGNNGPFSWNFSDKNPHIIEGIPGKSSPGPIVRPDESDKGFSDWDYTVTYSISVYRS